MKRIGMVGAGRSEDYVEKWEMMAIGIRQEDIAKRLGEISTSNDKIAKALEHITEGMPSMLMALRDELASHEKASLGRSIAREDAAIARHDEVTQTLLAAMRAQRAIEGPPR